MKLVTMTDNIPPQICESLENIFTLAANKIKRAISHCIQRAEEMAYYMIVKIFHFIILYEFIYTLLLCDNLSQQNMGWYLYFFIDIDSNF